ncbi:MAG: hypothetical protein O3C54_06525, partial [Proteobacteria bacterium]|nr:hypothetical protein [Pseudomonadota bacterium]
MADNKDPWKSESKPLSPTNLFGFSLIGGIASIFFGTYISSWIFNIAVPIGIMLYYSYTINKDTSDILSIEQKADSVYYMGFILTLVAMTSSLIALAYDEELRFNAIVINFGLALATTILGLAIRIMWLQLSSQSLADAESILKEKIVKRSQDLAEQTENVVGSMTALSNQLTKVSEPLKNNFDRLTMTMDINDQIINKLKQLDQSVATAAQSLQLISALAQNLATSSADLKRNVDEETIQSINNLKTSIIHTRPQVSELDNEISHSVNSINESLDILQENIRKTDEMIANSQR